MLAMRAGEREGPRLSPPEVSGDHMLARKLTVVIALVAVAATACGSSSKSSASKSTSPTSPSATTAASAGSSATTTPSKSYSGSSGSNFCDLARKDESAFNAKGFTGTAPDLKKLYGNLEPALEEAQSKAPDAIKADFATFVTAFKQVIKAFADANYDVTKISPTAFAGFADPKIKAASDHITQYISQVCRVTPTT
jgi:hypothetical protein